MHRFTQKITIVAFALMACFSLQSVQAADKLNVLVMSEDWDKDTVPRNSRVFRRVFTAMQNQLVEQGFDVYDETLLTMDEYEQDRTRRSRAEILDIARSVTNPPIDVVTNFMIYASVNNVGYTAKLRVRVEGEILHVKSKKFLGNFETMSPREWKISPKCAKKRECVLEEVGTKARILGNDLGAALTDKLYHLNQGGSSSGGALETAYELVLDGFTPDEVMAMEEYLVTFTGYESHRYAYNGSRRAEIIYEGTTSSSRMNRNMNKMLKVLDLKGRVSFSGNQITVQKNTMRPKEKKYDENEW